MAEEQMILTAREGDVLVITLNRPNQLNAAPPEMFDAIRAQIENLSGARAVLFLGAGRGFCSGADLMSSMMSGGDPGEASKRRLEESYHPCIRAIMDAPVPVVAGVQGAAAGIGCSLALAADFCVASEDAYFLQAFVNIALVPDGGVTWMLPRLVGRARAAEMMMLGERLPAARAYEWGLIHKVTKAESMVEEARALAVRLSEGPTATYAKIKRGIMFAEENTRDATMHTEADHQSEVVRSADAVEGRMAFAQKRKPQFKGH